MPISYGKLIRWKTPSLPPWFVLLVYPRLKLRGVIATASALFPELLRSMAQRDDLPPELREDLIRQAPRYLAAELITQRPADPHLIDAAAEAHGAFADLIVLCGRQGWMERSVELARTLASADTDLTVSQWSRSLGDPGRPPQFESA